MMDLKDQSVLILGLGASGLAMARWCLRCGARVTVADEQENPPNLALLQRESPGTEFVSGEFDGSLVVARSICAIFRSPGISPERTRLLSDSLQNSGIRLQSEVELFYQALVVLKASQAYSPAILAITGTNGKTTVTALTGQLVARSGKSVAVAGNIGPTLLDTLAQAVDEKKLPDVWVLELSSFQLNDVENFEATAAAVLNVSQDHLDWHGSMEAYAKAKARVFGSHSKMILNRDDAAVMAMAQQSPLQNRTKERLTRGLETFGLDMPKRPGDFGIEEVQGLAWLVRAMPAENTRRKRNGAVEEVFVQRLLPVDALQIRGKHNAANALAALSLAVSAGCSLAPLLFGLREYQGEPHRVQSIGVFDGVEFFDDSKGTNVGATVAAIGGLGADRKLVVILGGEGKGQDFSPLANPISRYARSVVLIGRDSSLIGAALKLTGVPLVFAADLVDAVEMATRMAVSGDAVLMSPACASFDMFKNYEHRAKVFVEAVSKIAGATDVLMGAPS